MRDPLSWAVPFFRAFGIPVKVHLLFFVVTIGLFLRQVGMKDNPILWYDVLLFTVVLLFGIILLHEFGHCFGARAVGGEAKEVLIWPLGGLASLEVPHTPRANFITTAAGPGVNVGICLACAVAMAAAGYLPSLNPLRNPYLAEVYNFRDGRTDSSYYGTGAWRAEAFRKSLPPEMAKEFPPEEVAKWAALSGPDRVAAPVGVVWAYRVFWLSWFLFLFNMIPAYPLDGGRLLQAVVWAKTDYRRGVTVAAYTGFAFAVVFLLVSIVANESLFMGLSLFILYESSMALHRLEADDGPFGYDFSAGYTSLEKDDPPPPRPKKVGWLARWRQARRARKLQREAEERRLEEERTDQLLEKIARAGKDSLTDEERRFLQRVSARKRNTS